MLMHRLYKPDDGEIIYHYCSAATFHAIASNGAIRFSDINMLNDSSEIRWAYSIFEDAATRLINRKGIDPSFPVIEKSFIDKIDDIIHRIQLIAHPFVACFSEASDLLGQWRSYADDGRGFAVGFNACTLQEQLPATFLKVLYDPEKQVREMMCAIIAIYLRLQNEQEQSQSTFFEDCVLLGTYMTSFKHPAFSEEREIRAVHAVSVKPQGDLIKFVDDGGLLGGDQVVSGGMISFQIRDNHLVAYTDATLMSGGKTSPICELVLGPKNHSMGGNISLFLGGIGYSNVTLKRSNAPYR